MTFTAEALRTPRDSFESRVPRLGFKPETRNPRPETHDLGELRVSAVKEEIRL
jgi:hypothetical protein